MKERSLAVSFQRRMKLRKLGWGDRRLDDVRKCKTLEEYEEETP